LQETGRGAATLGELLMRTPGLLQKAEQAILGLAETARSGVRLDDDTQEKLRARSRRSRTSDVALWIAALGILAIALKLYGAL
jgi:ubiquinone biosynthesis protein